jgi:hypothetical protein
LFAGTVPAMSRARRPQRRRRHREPAERPERSGGPRRVKNLQCSGREEAGLSGRGNSCPAEVGGGACGIQHHRDMQGRACRVPRGSEHRASARSTSPVDSRRRTAPNPQSCARRRASATLDGDNPGPGSMPIRAPLSKPELRADGANQRDRWNFFDRPVRAPG